MRAKKVPEPIKIPRREEQLGGMLVGQLIASHNATMECYRRAMIGEQTFEGRRENLNQANKLSRTYAALVEALDRHRGKGQQHVKVEHVHVNQGGQAIVGAVTPGGGDATPRRALALSSRHGPRSGGHRPGIAAGPQNARSHAQGMSEAMHPPTSSRRSKSWPIKVVLP